nr:MAG TPA: hypothetical protein [Caudoviricetes sp.]
MKRLPTNKAIIQMRTSKIDLLVCKIVVFNDRSAAQNGQNGIPFTVIFLSQTGQVRMERTFFCC